MPELLIIGYDFGYQHYASILENEGFAVEKIQNGYRGLVRAREKMYDDIIVDSMLSWGSDRLPGRHRGNREDFYTGSVTRYCIREIQLAGLNRETPLFVMGPGIRNEYNDLGVEGALDLLTFPPEKLPERLKQARVRALKET